MSLVKTLAKVAIGVAVAKGAGKMLAGRDGSVGDGGLFGGRHSPQREAGQTGLEDIMSDVFAGKGSSSGGLGGLLEGLQRDNPRTQDGGIDDLLSGSSGGSGGVLGSLVKELAGGQSGGGLGGLLGGLAGAAAGGQRNDSFGNVLTQSMQRRGEPEVAPSPEQDAAAGLMLRAMIQAAKSDGKFDSGEQQKLLKSLGDVSQDERDFVNAELQRPMDVKGLARQVPRGLEPQVYAMSLLGIDLDNQNEAKYLHSLASEFDLDQRQVNAIHTKMGAPALYS